MTTRCKSIPESLGEALPKAIAQVSELIGRMEIQAKDLDDSLPNSGDGTRMVIRLLRVKRDAALVCQQSGDVVAMINAYEDLKPAVELAVATSQPQDLGEA